MAIDTPASAATSRMVGLEEAARFRMNGTLGTGDDASMTRWKRLHEGAAQQQAGPSCRFSSESFYFVKSFDLNNQILE
ncbi:MAG TPA: hypothetical protein VGV37_07220 [Aliidongia sp.]|uniref:hypothetical protein n=1 Tax=Aliidongia sp. TaxID=1914230 RepID=UPI002DDC9C15|nr:hypothetical protein [Aliidongia sp.]HEV2674317.1 hypothetical protein [Aliidongia sp.]